MPSGQRNPEPTSGRVASFGCFQGVEERIAMMTSASRGRVAGAAALFFTLMATAALAAPTRTTAELATNVDKATIDAVHARIRVHQGAAQKAAGDLVGEMCVGEGPAWLSNPECKNC